MRQEGVLLALVEAVHLVDEDDGARAAPVPSPRRSCACSTASRMSFTPPSTALMVMNCASKASAISRAMVVLPVPGGPHRMQQCGWPDSKAMRSGMPAPSRCCWPMTSPSVSAAGARPAADAVAARLVASHAASRKRSAGAAACSQPPCVGAATADVGAGGGLNWKVPPGSAGLTSTLLNVDHRALAEAVEDFQRGQRVALKADLHALQLAVLALAAWP